ncbi:ATP-binding protein [Roseococcus sp. YIM B11640]|uniref:ATP-binding protein n=1 Tax=Roseococcus sp. YIM B11640 TaxID=3133973 RepID=UPI003C7CD880
MRARHVALAVGAATGLLILATCLLAARIVTRGDRLILANTQDTVRNAAEVAQSLVNRHLLQVEGQLSSLGELLDQGFISVAEPERTTRALREMTAHAFTYRNLMLADLDGQVWASALEGRRGRGLPIPPGAEPSLSVDLARIFGPSVHNPGRENTLLMARRLDPGGRGHELIAAAEIATSQLGSALAPLIHPAGLRIRLEGAGGTILVGGPGQEYLEASTLGDTGLGANQEVVRRPDRQGNGQVFATSRGTAYPGLRAVVAIAERDAFGAWWQVRRRVMIGAGLACFLIAAAGGALLLAIRARLRAADERAMAGARLAQAVEGLPHGFALWDSEDRLVICNTGYQELFGALPAGLGYEAFARQVAVRGLFVEPDAFPMSLEAEALREGYVERELTDGRWLRIAQRRMDSGATVVVLTDVTALRRAQEMADRATEAKSRLLSHVSHEMRTPLASLLRLSELLRSDTRLSQAQLHQASLVGASARHLLALANEVLDLAAMEARSLSLNLAPASPREVFEEALAMMQPLAEAKAVLLSFRGEGLPESMCTDATRLRQMVLNLVGNAVKFTPPGSLVRLDAAALVNPARLRFEVVDQGPGVPEHERCRLFQDFTRLGAMETEGTGLGLSITARLTELMGGTIGCDDSRSGSGACFWVELPLRIAAAVPSPEPSLETERRLRLLAVDDVASNLSVLRAMLASTGIELSTVMEGQAALEAVIRAAQERRPFDVVLMDVVMPGMDGMETTRRLRALPGGVGAMPVIGVTAGALPQDVEACRNAGMAAHLAKPVQRIPLLRAIAAVIEYAPQRTHLMELGHRAAELEACLPDGTMIDAMEAILRAIEPAERPELAKLALSALSALKAGRADAPSLVAEFLEELRRSFPGLESRAA